MPQCRHCDWQFSSWHWFIQHFALSRCPVLQNNTAPLPAVVAATTVDEPHTSTQTSDGMPGSITPASPEGTIQGIGPQPHPTIADGPLQQLGVSRETELLAQDPDWKPLARQIRRSDQHHCPFCNQWLARPTYLSRHVKAQHPDAYLMHDRVQSWLTERSSALTSPCAYCHVDFKVSKTGRLRHALACTTLYRTGLLHLLACAARSPQRHGRPSDVGNPAAAGAGKCGAPSEPDAEHAEERHVEQPGGPCSNPGEGSRADGHELQGEQEGHQRAGGQEARQRRPELAPRRLQKGDTGVDGHPKARATAAGAIAPNKAAAPTGTSRRRKTPSRRRTGSTRTGGPTPCRPTN